MSPDSQASRYTQFNRARISDRTGASPARGVPAMGRRAKDETVRNCGDTIIHDGHKVIIAGV